MKAVFDQKFLYIWLGIEALSIDDEAYSGR